jgi:hypothetical protein
MRIAMNSGADASSTAESPALAASAHTSCPLTTPAAVAIPQLRPPSSVLRMVSAVSWPGVTITTAETPRKAASCAALTATRR